MDFSYPDGPVWRVLCPSRQYGWLIVLAYLYVWVIIYVNMGLVLTVHGPLSEVLLFSTVKADHISLLVRMGRF